MTDTPKPARATVTEMIECQSKCACGDICRRVDEHLQHQCPKCNYENVSTAPDSTAATPLREANQQRVDAAAQRVRQAMDYRKYLPDDPFRKDVELLIEIALAPVLEICAVAAAPPRNHNYLDDLNHDLQDEEFRFKYLFACALDSGDALRIGIRDVVRALQPAAAQPQRESGE